MYRTIGLYIGNTALCTGGAISLVSRMLESEICMCAGVRYKEKTNWCAGGARYKGKKTMGEFGGLDKKNEKAIGCAGGGIQRKIPLGVLEVGYKGKDQWVSLGV